MRRGSSCPYCCSSPVEKTKGSSSSVAESSLGFRAERQLCHMTMLKNI